MPVKTPPEVSRARQKLGREIAVWEAGIRAAAGYPAKVAFGKEQLKLCKQKLYTLYSSGKTKKRFWSSK